MTDRRSQKKVSPTKKLKASVALSVMSTGQNRKKGQEFFALFTEKAPSIRDVKPPRSPYNCSKFVNSSTSTFALFTFSHSFPQNFYVDKKFRQSKVSYARFCLLNESYSNAIKINE